MKQDTQSGTQHVNVSVNLGLMFVIINNVGIKINADENGKNYLIKEYIIKNVFGIECECECDKACDVGEYLDHENYKCRKKLVEKLVDECTETIKEVKLAKITLAENEIIYKCSSCTVYTVLFWTFFTIYIGGIGAYFVYFHGYLKKMFTRETTIY